MRRNSLILKSIFVFTTIALLILFAYYQYNSYQKDIQITKRQLTLSALHGNILQLDEALTMSARLFVLTGDSEWHKRYKELAPRFDATFSEINKLLPTTYSGKEELENASQNLYKIEAEAFNRLLFRDTVSAKRLLFNDSYKQQKLLCAAGMQKLTGHMDNTISSFMVFHRDEAYKNAMAILIIILLILTIAIIHMRITRIWQTKIARAERDRAEAAISAKTELKKANFQLRLLSSHLQDVREEERRAIAYEIHEVLGQQIAGIKLKLTALLDDEHEDVKLKLNGLREVSEHLASTLQFLENLATEVFPSILQDIGLFEALELESERLSNQLNIQILFSADSDSLDVDRKLALNIFRIYQEKIISLGFNGVNDIVTYIGIESGFLVLKLFYDTKKNAENKESLVIENIAIEERIKAINGLVSNTVNPQQEYNFELSIPL